MQDEKNFYHNKKSEFEKKTGSFSNFYEYMIVLMETLVKIKKKTSKFNHVFDTQLNYFGIKNMQWTVIHGNSTVNRTKSQVTFGLGAAESEYTLG